MNSSLAKYVLFIILGLCGGSGFATERAWPWEIRGIQVREIEEPSLMPMALEDSCDPSEHKSSPFGTGVSLEEIILVGEKLWTIVEANKPVVSFKAPVVHGLPRGLACWSDLEKWQPPKTRTFEVVYVNGFNMEAVKFRFRLHYTYGGGSEGKGLYLANVTVMPAELNVVWGYTFDAHVEALNTVNLGTKDNPIAGIELNTKWTVKTWAKESQGTVHVFVQGDGAVRTAE